MNRRTAIKAVLTAAAGATLASCQGFSLPSPGGRRGGDGKPLSLAVQAALRKHPETTVLQIQVFSTDEDVVILKGTVLSEADFYAAERVATAVPDVRRVDNALFVR